MDGIVLLSFVYIYIYMLFLMSLNSQQQNAMGSLQNIDFGVFWASWGRSGKEPGSGKPGTGPEALPRFRV